MKTLLIILAIVGIGPASTANAKCPFVARQHVRISGPGDNPRTWLWNSIAALKTFNLGLGDDYFIFFHTKLLENRTLAIVNAACPAGDRSIIGVHVLSGDHRGANGFVNAMDAAYPP